MRRSEIIDNDNEIYPRIYFSNGLQKLTDILLFRVLMEFQNGASVNRIKAERVCTEFRRILDKRRMAP